MAVPTTSAAAAQSRLLNRELSWLELNARVLELAADERVPLLERIKFCSIFSSNLDEFFMVRVAGLLEQASSGRSLRSPDGRTPQETLAEIRNRALELTRRQSRLWSKELRPALAAEGIVIAGCEQTDEQMLASVFESEIAPVLTPLAVGPGQSFPYVSGLSLSLGVFVRDPETGEERFARVKVPETLPRLPEVAGVFVPMEDVIAHFLPRLFPGMEIVERAPFRVTRDADFEISDEADDLLEAIETELRRRPFGEAVRLEVSSSMSRRMVDRISRALGLADAAVYPVRGLLDLADVSELTQLGRPDLKDEPWAGVTIERFENGGVFDSIRQRDIAVHRPYQSFKSSFEAFVRTAAGDPDVLAINATVYRTSDESPLVPALIDASEDGKQSVCLVELKARFDERRNIRWSRALEQAGVHVVHGPAQLKVHAKTTLVVRRERDGLRRYAHVSTGNYHAVTARLYEDIGIFTADEEITADVADLFNYLTGFARPERFRKLLVAPFNLRKRLVEEIRAVARAAGNGERARIRIKVNSIVDEEIVGELYRASGAGVEIDIVARAICTLRPGVEGLSENIRVRSVLGRFLEHSRLYLFEAGDEVRCFLGSADLMPRNLDRRVEVLAPVEDEAARAEIATVFDTLLSDNVGAWELRADGTWRRVRQRKGERAKGTQQRLMRRALVKARRRVS